MHRLTIETEADGWRLKCPNGHSNVAPTNHHWWCPTCANHWEDVDPEFDRARDAKTGLEYTRDQVDFQLDSPEAPA